MKPLFSSSSSFAVCLSSTQLSPCEMTLFRQTIITNHLTEKHRPKSRSTCYFSTKSHSHCTNSVYYIFPQAIVNPNIYIYRYDCSTNRPLNSVKLNLTTLQRNSTRLTTALCLRSHLINTISMVRSSRSFSACVRTAVRNHPGPSPQ